MSRVTFALICLVGLPGILPAQGLDPRANRPYELQVVLRFSEHRILNRLFQQQVERELRDSLQAAFGELANVDVARDHPYLKEVVDKGLQYALDSWKFVEDRKTHFVFVDFVGGRYEIQTRQYDGYSGLASPTIRQSRTDDRFLVARNAALLVDQDFGLVGTIVKPDEKAERVEIVIMGGKLPGALEGRVKKDDIFWISQIVQQGGKQSRSYRVPWAILQVAEPPREGACLCRLYARWGNALLPQAGSLGFRCLKLGTTQEKLRLRLIVDDKLDTPLSSKSVIIGAQGYEPETERRSTSADGLVQSQQAYRNVAFVRILDGKAALTQFPIEIVDDRLVTCAVRVQQGSEQLGQLTLRHDRWIRRLNDAVAMSTALIKDLNAMVDKPLEETMKRAQDGIQGVLAETRSIEEEREKLAREAADIKMKLDLSDADQQITELKSRRELLVGHVAKLQDLITKENDPKRRKWKEQVQKADLLETQAEFAQAIDIYARIIEDGADDPAIKQRLDSLRKAWAIKDDKHQDARAFIYDTWSQMKNAEEMKENLGKVRQALQAFRDAGDFLTPQRLLRVNSELALKLAKEAEGLRLKESDDDRKTGEIITALAEDLKKLNTDLVDYLKKGKRPGSK